jgi:hypothetical protein
MYAKPRNRGPLPYHVVQSLVGDREQFHRTTVVVQNGSGMVRQQVGIASDLLVCPAAVVGPNEILLIMLQRSCVDALAQDQDDLAPALGNADHQRLARCQGQGLASRGQAAHSQQVEITILDAGRFSKGGFQAIAVLAAMRVSPTSTSSGYRARTLLAKSRTRPP